MAKELPYFRFTVQEWQNGDISLERFELQGLFISVCGFYWIKDCDCTLAMLQKRFSNATNEIQELIDLDIIKHENRHDKIEIVFLNNQYDLLSEKRKLRQSAGSKGGNAKAMLKQKGSYKDKDKDKDNNKDKDKGENEILFDKFWNLYGKKEDSKKCKEKFLKLTDSEIQQIFETLPSYILKHHEIKFRKNPLTYLNGKCWNDDCTPPTQSINFEVSGRTNDGGRFKRFVTHEELEKMKTNSYFKIESVI